MYVMRASSASAVFETYELETFKMWTLAKLITKTTLQLL